MPDLSLDELASMPERWPFLRETLLSEQVPVCRVIELLESYPDFQAWFQGAER